LRVGGRKPLENLNASGETRRTVADTGVPHLISILFEQCTPVNSCEQPLDLLVALRVTIFTPC
jgi:hypothetical protein